MSKKKTKAHSKTLLLRKEQSTHCYYCDTEFHFYHLGRKKTIDHFVPTVNGGLNINPNKVVCCFNCNHLKAGMTPQAFLAFLHEARETGFTKRKLSKYYTTDKIDFMISRLQSIIHDQHGGTPSSVGYFSIKQLKNENAHYQEEGSQILCEPCIV